VAVTSLDPLCAVVGSAHAVATARSQSFGDHNEAPARAPSGRGCRIRTSGYDSGV